MSGHRSCEVCGLEGAGLHFGVFSCRACAAFFRRTVTLRLLYRCAKGNDCQIGHKMRSSCRKCRFDKCCALGMKLQLDVSDHVDDDSPSTESAAEKAPDAVTTSNSENTSTDAFSSTSALRDSKNLNFAPTSTAYMELTVKQTEPSQKYTFKVTASDDTRMIVIPIIRRQIDQHFMQGESALAPSQLPYGVPQTLMQSASIAFAKLQDSLPKTHFVEGDVYHFDLEDSFRLFLCHITAMAEFVMQLSCFASLPHEQKWHVFRGFWTKMSMVERFIAGYRLCGAEMIDKVVMMDGSVHSVEIAMAACADLAANPGTDVWAIFRPGFKMFQAHFVMPLIKLKPTNMELVFTILYALWDVKILRHVDKETIERARQIQTRIADELCNHYIYEEQKPNYANRIRVLVSVAAALNKLEMQRQEDRTLSNTFSIFKHDIFITEFCPELRS